MRPESPWEARDAILEQNHRTSFEETSAIEIDERLAQEDPEHEESLEFFRLNRGRCSEAAEAMLKLLELLMPNKGKFNTSTPSSLGFQVIVLLWLLQSSKGDLGRMSMAAIAEKVGCTRALLSHYAKRFERVLGFHGRGMKGKEASEAFFESSRRGWETRRRKAGQADPAPVHVSLEEIDAPTAYRTPRRFELEDEQEISADSEGFSFDSHPRENDHDAADI
ncbi:MAG: hypothetical protein WAL87_09940 [Chthoniobacterales bacterium]